MAGRPGFVPARWAALPARRRVLRVGGGGVLVCAQERSGVLFANGRRVSLRRVAEGEVDGRVARYVVCPECGAAYVANLVSSVVRVRCAKCGNEFVAGPEQLYCIATQKQKTQTQKRQGGGVGVDEVVDAESIACPHFADCPGCSLDKRLSTPPVLAAAKSFLVYQLRHRAAFASVQMARPTQWRSHAKLAVRQVDGAPALGLFRLRSHELIPIPDCVVQSPQINQAAQAVQTALRKAKVVAYNELTGRGQCRYVVFTVQRSTGKVQLTFVWNASSWKQSNPTAQRLGSILWKTHGDILLHSIWFNWNTAPGNAILSPYPDRFYHMYGSQYLVDPVMGIDFYFQPYAFRQANLDAFETQVMPRLLSYIWKGAAVAEFCAGVGLIGLIALKEKKLRALTASEINEAAQSLFWKSYTALKHHLSSPRTARVNYNVGSDTDTAYMLDDGADIVIVDPPRAGLSEQFVLQLANPSSKSLKRVIYLSCGFDAFKNDARVLCQGQWKLKHCHAFILFPGTDHIELLAIFDRHVSKLGAAPTRTKSTNKQ